MVLSISYHSKLNLLFSRLLNIKFKNSGLAPYHQWREVCNLSPIQNWLDLENATRPSSFRVLKEIYQYVFKMCLGCFTKKYKIW